MQRFPVGTVYRTRAKHVQTCAVTDYLTTRNLADEVVRAAYVSTHVFLGQPIAEIDVSETTIARGLVADLPNATRLLDHAFWRVWGEPMTYEQRECLNDSARRDEAADMLDDFAARLGIDPVVVALGLSALGSAS